MAIKGFSTPDIYKSALNEFNKGNFRQALAKMESVVDANFDIWHLRGVIHALLPDDLAARACLAQAVALKPADYQARYNLARIEKQLGNLDAAESLFLALHAENQIDFQVSNELGIIAFMRNDYRRAESFFQKCLAVKPRFDLASINLAAVYTHQGRFVEALAMLDSAQNQDSGTLQLQRATILYKSGRFVDAVEWFARLENSPSFATLSEMDKSIFHANYGASLLEVNDFVRAEAQYALAQQAAPDSWLTMLNMAQFQEKVRHNYELADEIYERALATYPDNPDLHDRYAVFLQSQSLFAEALPHHRFALSIRPDDQDFQFNLSGTELGLGMLAEGWKHYDCRWVRTGAESRPALPWPEWQGEDGTGKSILVYREQGLGDEFMYATCLPDLAKRFAHVVYACHPKLVTLFSRSYPEVVIVPNRVPRHELVLDKFDYMTGVASLPRWLRSEMSHFPTESRVLVDDMVRTSHLRARLADLGGLLKVGIAWRSGYQSDVRDVHYLDLEQLAPILNLPGICFINLQYHLTDAERHLMDSRFPGKIFHVREVDLFEDLDSVACLIKACDLVIAPGTSVYMQAGALGVPTLLLNAMPRDYYQLGSAEAHRWFPSVTMLGKPLRESWDAVVEQAAYIIAQLAHEKMLSQGLK